MNKLIRFFFRVFVCSFKGHVLSNVQYRDFKDYFLKECVRCKFSDGIKHKSPITIEHNNDGTYEIITLQAAGGGGGIDANKVGPAGSPHIKDQTVTAYGGKLAIKMRCMACFKEWFGSPYNHDCEKGIAE